MRRIKLTPQLQETICAFIRAGGYPHVAAEAAGIPVNIFNNWLARGGKPESRGKYRNLFLGVQQAQAQARLNAEISAYQDDPIAWLKSGPGKERPNAPGWTTSIKPQVTNDNRTVNLLLAPEMQGMFAAILQILSPFPEARAALAQALAGKGMPALPSPESGK
jgi:hypothetical protein